MQRAKSLYTKQHILILQGTYAMRRGAEEKNDRSKKTDQSKTQPYKNNINKTTPPL